jgi:hypothetical protein
MQTLITISAGISLTLALISAALALTSAALAQGGVPSPGTPRGTESRTMPADLPEAHLIRGEVLQLTQPPALWP